MKKTKVLLTSALVNIFLAIIKILGGIFGSSQTLLVDGIHSLSDLSTDFISIIGAKISLKPADKEHPFGHGKLENLVSMVIGLIIIFMGITVLKNVFTLTVSIPAKYLIILSLITIISKYLLSKYLHKKGKEYQSQIILANSKESKMDVLTSVFTLIIIILSQFSNKIFWLKYLDLIGGVLMSMLIIYVGLNIIKDQTNEIIGKSEDDKYNYIKIGKIAKKLQVEINNIQLIKFGVNYLALIEINLDEKLTLKEADLKRSTFEKIIKDIKNIEYVVVKMLPKE